MSEGHPYDDLPWPIDHGPVFDGVTEGLLADRSFAQRIESIKGIERTQFALMLNRDDALWLKNVLEHATQHACAEGLQSLWTWCTQVVYPKLLEGLAEWDRRLEGDDGT